MNRRPEQILTDVLWSFTGAEFVDRADCNMLVRLYQIQIAEEDTWKPDEIVFDEPYLAVTYICWREEVELELTELFQADDGKAFTAGELLFKLHNTVVEDLRELDHHFFEGLRYANTRPDDGIACYELRLGS